MSTNILTFVDHKLTNLLNAENENVLVDYSNGEWYTRIKEIITKEVGTEVFNFIDQHAGKTQKICVNATRTQFNIDKLKTNAHETIVNLKRINDFRRINKYFEAVNTKLPKGGIFISSVETHAVRRIRVLNKIPKPFNYAHYFLDVLLTRVSPKLLLTKHLYFNITGGKGRVLTKAETFGRLYACGFEIVEEKMIGNMLHFVARKVKEPAYDKDPTYGPLIKLKRLGYNGQTIKVYKFRTMYPFSEYLQQYVFEKNNLKEGGKLNKDFRISHEGKIMRKYWIDELPMIINFIKNEMKLIGVRPLSKHYYSLYPKELQEKRLKVKPGLLPPFYADMPKTLDDIVASELRYLKAYEKAPLKTDLQYLSKIISNIVFKGKRSC